MFLVCYLRDIIIKMCNEHVSESNFKNLRELHEEIIDLTMYLQDIFSLKIQKIDKILINCIMYYLISPILIGGIISLTKVNN